MERPFERVYTVHDYYDGLRGGFADFGGMPHAYRSIWREDLGEWDPENRYELSPVSSETLELVLEDWEIWKRWEEAFYAGQAMHDTHPALPADAARHAELEPVVERALEVDPARRRIAMAEFRAHGGGAWPSPTSRVTHEVRWTPAA